MGQTESKQAFRTEIFRLSTVESIPDSDLLFWAKLWQVPENASDIFTLLGENDVRLALQAYPGNVATLTKVVSGQIINRTDHTAELQLMNCVRVLTRVFPIIFESGTKVFEDDLLWSTDMLGENLVSSLVDMLFDKQICGTDSIWEMGVGCHSETKVSGVHESNRSEILRLLVTLCSKQLYSSVSHVTSMGSRFLTCLVSLNKSRSLLLLCSLLNTSLVQVLREATAFQSVFRGSSLSFWSLQLLLLLVVYYPPGGQKNNFRFYIGKLKQDVDFEFISKHITEILAKSAPSSSSSSLLTGKRETRVNEIISLLWEVIQSNKRFLPWLMKHEYLHKIVSFILQQITTSPSTQTLRLLSNFLLYLSDDDVVVSSFDSEGPVNFNHVLGQLFSVITLPREEINPIIPTLVECVYNLSVQAKHVDYTVSAQLVDIFDVLSSPSFLFANSTNRFLLELTLESITAMLEYNFQANKALVFVLQKRRASFEKLQRLIKEKGKEPGDEDYSWLEDLPMTTIDTVFAMVESAVPYFHKSESSGSPSGSPSASSSAPASTIIDTIGTLTPPVQPKTFHKIEFAWDPVLLGWYLSLIWTTIFSHEAKVGRQVTSLADTMSVGGSAGPVGVWNRTHTKLFKVQQSSATPNLGAVDAVALNVWKRITNR